MLVSFINVATLSLAATAGASPIATIPDVPVFVVHHASVDSTYALTEDQLKNYIAVKKDLRAYWGGHQTEATAAKAKEHRRTILFRQEKVPVGVFDYPTIVKEDTSIAKIFTSNHFSPDAFEPTQVAAYEAVATLVANASKGALPANATTLGRNVELVKSHRNELALVGLVLEDEASSTIVNGSGGNGTAKP